VPTRGHPSWARGDVCRLRAGPTGRDAGLVGLRAPLRRLARSATPRYPQRWKTGQVLVRVAAKPDNPPPPGAAAPRRAGRSRRCDATSRGPRGAPLRVGRWFHPVSTTAHLFWPHRPGEAHRRTSATIGVHAYQAEPRGRCRRRGARLAGGGHQSRQPVRRPRDTVRRLLQVGQQHGGLPWVWWRLLRLGVDLAAPL